MLRRQLDTLYGIAKLSAPSHFNHPCLSVGQAIRAGAAGRHFSDTSQTDGTDVLLLWRRQLACALTHAGGSVLRLRARDCHSRFRL